MGDIFQHSLTVFLAFFSIMNPIANTAVFVGLTGEENRKRQFQIAFKALFISFCIIVAFSLLGKSIFHMFGITLPALRITGGVLVFVIGYHMLQGENSSLHKQGNHEVKDLAVSPLAVPILAGPGTIATAMNMSASGNWDDIFITVLTFGALCFLTFICFIFGQKLVHFLGESGVAIVTRLMGLILSVIGVQMLMSGVGGALKIFNAGVG